VRHYQGLARSRRRRLGEPEATVKHLLYAYRVQLTGIHLMRTGEVVANLITLNRHFGLEPVDELVARKQAGGESMLLDGGDLVLHLPMLDRLEAELVQAHDRSPLPEEPTTAAALEELVVRVRLEAEGR
jgi:predicted nucleotidyltransferase